MKVNTTLKLTLKWNPCLENCVLCRFGINQQCFTSQSFETKFTLGEKALGSIIACQMNISRVTRVLSVQLLEFQDDLYAVVQDNK